MQVFNSVPGPSDQVTVSRTVQEPLDQVTISSTSSLSLAFCEFITETVVIRSSRVSVNSLKILNPFIHQKQPFTSFAQNNCSFLN